MTYIGGVGDLRRPDHRRHAGDLSAGHAERHHRCLAALLRPAVHRHGDVRARRHRRPVWRASGPLRRGPVAPARCPSTRWRCCPGWSRSPALSMVIEMTYQLTVHAPRRPGDGLPRCALRTQRAAALAGAAALCLPAARGCSCARRGLPGTPMARRWRRHGRGGWRRDDASPALAARTGWRCARASARRRSSAASTSLSAASAIAIIGPNGAGKSTLFNLISGRFRPSAADPSARRATSPACAPQRINRRGLSRSFQITNIFPGCQRVRESALRGLLWAWATDIRSGASSPRLRDVQRAHRGDTGRDQPADRRRDAWRVCSPTPSSGRWRSA